MELKRKGHALAVFAGVNGQHPVDRHHDSPRRTRKACFEFDEIIAQLQAAGGVVADVVSPGKS